MEMSAVQRVGSPNSYEKVQKAEEQNGKEKTNSVSVTEGLTGLSGMKPDCDRYVKEGSAAAAPSGIYKPEQDENGNKRISFDDPEVEPDSNSEEKKCTINTDQVDAEIEKLKKEKQSLENKLSQAPEDGGMGEKIQAQLERVTSELAQKDNDQYRKQNAVVSG